MVEIKGLRKKLQNTHVGCALRHKYEIVTAVSGVKLAPLGRADPAGPNLEAAAASEFEGCARQTGAERVTSPQELWPKASAQLGARPLNGIARRRKSFGRRPMRS